MNIKHYKNIQNSFLKEKKLKIYKKDNISYKKVVEKNYK